jgi:GT2 family glycosyltransferase
VRAVFDEHSDVVGVGGFVTNQPSRRVRRLDEWTGLDSRRHGAVLASGRNIPVSERPSALLDVDWLSGCAMSYRRWVLDAEPPDESFPFEGEDVQLSHRVRRLGRLVVAPDADLVHHESGANRVAGAAQVVAEMTTRHRRVVATDSGLSARAFWVSAYAQLAKYAVTGVLTLSRRRLEVARGTARAMRIARLPPGAAVAVNPSDVSTAD